MFKCWKLWKMMMLQLIYEHTRGLRVAVLKWDMHNASDLDRGHDVGSEVKL